MKYSLLTLALACMLTTVPAHAEMTDVQRDELAKRLDKLINQSKATLTSRQATAYQAYKQGLSSSTAALELYLRCVEKVDFEDAGKKTSDFRDWKRKEKDKLGDPSFKLALRHQLNWLVLTIDAARTEEDDYTSLSPKARASLENIFRDAKALGGNHSILKQNVLNSVFAKAYGFGSYKVEDWPTTPLNVDELYEKVVFPPLREYKKAASLRSAWQQKISYKQTAIEAWSPVPKSKTIGMKKSLKPPAYYKFLEKDLPNLIWQMELDVYKAGDEYGAASRMITHLSKHINHLDATKWAKELHELISPEEVVEIAEADPNNSEVTEEPSTEKSNPDPNKEDTTYIKLSVD